MQKALPCLLFLLLGLPLQARADQVDTVTVNVHSKAEWKEYAKKYGNTWAESQKYYVKLKLWDNLWFDNTQKDHTVKIDIGEGYYVYWGYFNGELDGQGHTINVNFEDDSDEWGVIYRLCGQVKNLNIKGNIEYRYGGFSYTENAALAFTAPYNLEFTNCHSRINYREVSSHGVTGTNSSIIGGFVNRVSNEKYRLVFKDCSFVGSFSEKKKKKEYWYDTGGFVGHAGRYASVDFQNCLSCINFSEGVKGYSTGYFIGVHTVSANIYSSNCYYYSASAPEAMFEDGARCMNEDQIKSGEVAMRLANGRTGDNNPWRQTLGTDAQPETTVSSATSKEVFHCDEVTHPATTDKWTTLFYPNHVTLPSGVEKYIANDIQDGKVNLSALTLSNTANVPMVLFSESGFDAITLPALYYNKVDQNTILRGAYNGYTSGENDYALDGANSKFIPIEKEKDVTPWTCYVANGTGEGYDLQTSSTGTYAITSKDAWNTFKSIYGSGEGTEVNAYLTCDLTLTADDVAMESFKGTFDGQGHSIIYDFNDLSTTRDVDGSDGTVYGFIKYAAGTIKNLNITGSIKTKCRFIGGPLAWANYYGTLNVENCHSDVDFCTTYTNLEYTLGSGFLTTTTSEANFTDCSFTGSFTSDKITFSGGFVGQIFYNVVNFKNCYSNIHTGENSAIYEYSYTTASAGYFVGTEQYKDMYSYTNCYAHNSSKLDFSSYSDGVTIATDEEVANGTTTEKLHADRTFDDSPWIQLPGVHSDPWLKEFVKDGKYYRFVEGTIVKDENAHWKTLYYPGDVTFTVDQGITVYDQFATDDDGNLLAYENLSGIVKAGTPVLLYAENGFTEDIKLPAVFYNEKEFDGGDGYLTGVLKATDASTLCTLSESADGTASLAATEGTTLPAWQCYSPLAYAKIIPDGAIISSKDDWNLFKTKYNGKKQGFARLATDITLTDDDEPMENFVGTFDGQGHTITVNYTSGNDQNPHAPFKYAKGSTIKNLKLSGTLTISNYSRFYASPLIYKVEGTADTPDVLTIENCHSDVSFVAESGYPIIWAGGFANFVKEYATVNFSDCSFTGSFNSSGEVTNSGGFIGYYDDVTTSTVSFTNCFSAPTVNASYNSGSPLGYFGGGGMSKINYNVTNCYALASNVVKNSGKKVTLLDAATLATGAATYALNADRTSDAPWRQTIDTDALPQLKLFSPDSKEVNLAADTVKIGSMGWATHYYPLAQTLPDGVKAYTVSGVSQEKGEYVVNLEEVKETIPAFTPVLLCTLDEGATEAEKTITIEMPSLYYNDVLKDVEGEGNGQAFQLVGVTRNCEAFNGCYVLQQQTNATTGEKKTAFYRVDTEVATPTVPAWKCVFVYTATGDDEGEAGNTRVVQLRLDDETTGIDAAGAINSILGDGKTYDLSGRRVTTLQKGNVYIKNGQKFIIK